MSDSVKAWRSGERDKNGYAQNILGGEDHFCFYCKKFCDTARHEIFYGTGRRELCKEDGLWVPLCPYHHDFEHQVGLEFESGKTLKQVGQHAYERTHSREEFIKRYGRNYL